MSDPTKAQVTGGEFNLGTCTVDDFEGRMDTDRELRDRYLADPRAEEFSRINRLKGAQMTGEVIPPEVPPATSSAPAGEEGEPEAEQEEYEITLKVPKRLLQNDRNDYLKNRKPEEAVMEALRGKYEQEGYIDTLKERNTGLTVETTSLRRQLLEAAEKANQPAAPKTPAVETVDFDADPDELDLYDPDVHDKVRAALKSMKQKTAEVTPPAEPQKETPEVANLKKSMENSVFQKQVDEIENLQRAYPELRTGKTFLELDKEMAAFYDRAGVVGGIKSPGEVANIYFSEGVAGTRLRELCSERGIMPPEGAESHRTIMGVREKWYESRNRIRSALADASGKKPEEIPEWKVPDIAGNTFAELYRAQLPPVDVGQIRMSSRIDGHLEAQRAAQNAQNHAPVVPPDVGSPAVMDAGGLPVEEFQRLMNKPASSLTPEEARIIVSVAEKIGALAAVDPLTREKAAKG